MGNRRKKRGLNGGLSGAMRVRTLRLERACDETMARPAGNKYPFSFIKDKEVSFFSRG
jgi:hypothetical protein